MRVEICDLCHKRVFDTIKTTVTIEDYKGMSIEFGHAFPAKRKFKGVICDECLRRLRDGVEKELKNAL